MTEQSCALIRFGIGQSASASWFFKSAESGTMMMALSRSTQWSRMRRTNIIIILILLFLQQQQQQNSALAGAFVVPGPPRRRRASVTSNPLVAASSTKAEASPPFFSSSSNQKTLATGMTMTEKVAMNVIGVGLTTAVVTALANSKLNAFLMTPTPDLLNLEEVGEAILRVSLPSSTAEVVSVTLAESAAGVVAAAVSLFVAVGLGAVGQQNNIRTRETLAVDTIGRAIGNGDFLVAQATAMPVLESLGIPPAVATIVAVVFAAIPAEVVKITSAKQTVKRMQEEMLLRQLLREEEEEANRRRRDPPFSFFDSLNNNKQVGNSKQQEQETTLTELDMDILSTKNVNDSLAVEIVSDLIKWLGFTVLCADLGGRIVMSDGRHLFPGLESAAFGATASLSAQIYSDILYAYFGFGGVEKQRQVRSRTIQTWLSAYANEAISGATLFGVYEIIKIPSKAFISAFLSGGVEGCIGSQEFDLCVQSYVLSNPPAATPEAELRSLITALVSVVNQLVPWNI
jgi:hypothetical protein